MMLVKKHNWKKIGGEREGEGSSYTSYRTTGKGHEGRISLKVGKLGEVGKKLHNAAETLFSHKCCSRLLKDHALLSEYLRTCGSSICGRGSTCVEVHDIHFFLWKPCKAMFVFSSYAVRNVGFLLLIMKNGLPLHLLQHEPKVTFFNLSFFFQPGLALLPCHAFRSGTYMPLCMTKISQSG